MLIETFESFALARWDEATSNWTSEKIVDVCYIPDLNVLEYQVLEGGIFALLKDKSLHLPRRQWSLRPLDNSNQAVMFEVETSYFSLQIIIEVLTCLIFVL
ncbi:hypothetical protein GJ496_008420 [Pomphorhynchus laevis]|nr:hypothetical protein GJ496_008420 [Pomphorhynchus laevis]